MSKVSETTDDDAGIAADNADLLRAQGLFVDVHCPVHPVYGRPLSACERIQDHSNISPQQTYERILGGNTHGPVAKHVEDAVLFYMSVPDCILLNGEWELFARSVEDGSMTAAYPMMIVDLDTFVVSMQTCPTLLIDRRSISSDVYARVVASENVNEARKICPGLRSKFMVPRSRADYVPVSEEVAAAYLQVGLFAWRQAKTRDRDRVNLSVHLTRAITHYATLHERGELQDLARRDMDWECRRVTLHMVAQGLSPSFAFPVRRTAGFADASVYGLRQERARLPNGTEPASTVEAFAWTIACKLAVQCAFARLPPTITHEALRPGQLAYVHSSKYRKLNGTLVRVCVDGVRGTLVKEAENLQRGFWLERGARFLGNVPAYPRLCRRAAIPFEASDLTPFLDGVTVKDGWEAFPDLAEEASRFQCFLKIGNCFFNEDEVYFFGRRNRNDVAIEALCSLDALFRQLPSRWCVYKWVAFFKGRMVRGVSETAKEAATRIRPLCFFERGAALVCEACLTPIESSGSSAGDQADVAPPPLVCGHLFHQRCVAPFMAMMGRGQCPRCDTVTHNVFAVGANLDRCGIPSDGFEYGPPIVPTPSFFHTEKNDDDPEWVDAPDVNELRRLAHDADNDDSDSDDSDDSDSDDDLYDVADASSRPPLFAPAVVGRRELSKAQKAVVQSMVRRALIMAANKFLENKRTERYEEEKKDREKKFAEEAAAKAEAELAEKKRKEKLVKEGRERIAAEADEKWNRLQQLNVLNAARRRDGDRGKRHESAEPTPEAVAKEIAAREEFEQKRADRKERADKERKVVAEAKAKAAARAKRDAQKAEGAREAARSAEFRAPKGKALFTLSTVGEEWTAPSEQEWTAADPNTIGLGDALLSHRRGEAGPSGVHDDASVWESVATSEVPARPTIHGAQRVAQYKCTHRDAQTIFKYGKVKGEGNTPGTVRIEYKNAYVIAPKNARKYITFNLIDPSRPKGW